MIDIKIDANRHITRFDVAGGDRDIAAEVGCLIGIVYAQTKAINPKAAERFRAMVGVMLWPESPVWTRDPVKGDGVVSAVIPCGKRGEGPGQ